MKYISAVAFALLYSADVSAVQLEHFYHLAQSNGMIYVPDHQIYLRQAYTPQQSYVQSQFKPRRIIDEDGDGVEDNVKLDQYALDKFRTMVFSAPVEDMHNTHNGEMPGHKRFGDSPEPGVNPWAREMAKEKAEYEARLADKKKLQELEASGFTGVQLDSEIKFDEIISNSDYDKEPIQELSESTIKVDGPRRITDKDGDGVEDNVHKTQDELDKFRKPVFGAPVQDIHNTKHGELPGHLKEGETPEPTGHPMGFTKVATDEQNMVAVQALTQQQISAQFSASKDVSSYSDYDKEPSLLQLDASVFDKFFQLQQFIQSPEDLDIQLQSSVRNLY